MQIHKVDKYGGILSVSEKLPVSPIQYGGILSVSEKLPVSPIHVTQNSI